MREADHPALNLLLAIACANSENRLVVAWRIVLPVVVMRLLLIVLLLKAPNGSAVFLALHDLLLALERATQAGEAV